MNPAVTLIVLSSASVRIATELVRYQAMNLMTKSVTPTAATIFWKL